MTEINQILEKAKKGIYPSCRMCSRNPKFKNTAFALSCEKHFGCQEHGLIIIARDPGGKSGGASETGILCPICNCDKSATIVKHYLSFLDIANKSIYFLNAILHGFYNENSKNINENERESCKPIINEIVDLLKPKIILAFGLEALHTSLELLKEHNINKPTLKDMIRNDFDFGLIKNIRLFSMPHPAYAKTNLLKNHLNEEEVWGKIALNINSIIGDKSK